MPWSETSPLKERVRFSRDHRSGLFAMTERCERFRISRKTGYKWVERFEVEGTQGLEERSCARARGALVAPRKIDRVLSAIAIGSWVTQ